MKCPPTKNCNVCGLSIERPHNYSNKQWENRKFCSPHCLIKGRNNILPHGWNLGKKYGKFRVCAICGLNSNNARVQGCLSFGGDLCSKHESQWRANGFFLDDNRKRKTPLAKRVRKCIEYINWRTAVYKKDNYTCQICFKKGGYLEADHHPILFSEQLKLYAIDSLEKAKSEPRMWDVNNGRALCIVCHRGSNATRPPHTKLRKN